ncbi:hypothetical protein [Pedobacter sp. Hv1]|uniref:glycosyl-4,4'-diaponeurosporenoate acyltransferase CrtO family protein n=1 Tax=Pedobacter sp. Hv1 TaxID=1740090 RepID=UPI0006D8CCED|nr:hypothetical protein [Pedobacter sp. Hv1]KQC01724.1 hypothetical protein AQF98_04955 [Pedobacter sp. Hv1]
MKKALILVSTVIITSALIYIVIHYIGMQGFAFAWTLNFILMAAALTFTETLKSPLNATYYHEKGWEKGGKIYEQLGINFFRKLLIWIGWEKLNKKSNPVAKHTNTLIHLHNRTKQSELGHLLILIIVLGFTIFVAFKFGFVKALWLILLNVLLNLYPILLQRYNRPRLERAINLSKRR